MQASGGDALFRAGRAVMVTNDSWRLSDHTARLPLKVGIGPLPTLGGAVIPFTRGPFNLQDVPAGTLARHSHGAEPTREADLRDGARARSGPGPRTVLGLKITARGLPAVGRAP